MSSRFAVWVLVIFLWPVLPIAKPQESDRAIDPPAQQEAIDVDEPATTPPLLNSGFEQSAIGEHPAGWVVPDIPGYDVATTDDQPFEGRQCATIKSTVDSEQSPFGNLILQVDATPYRGKRVRLRAAVRTDVAEKGNQAQMWFRVDRRTAEGNRAVGDFDNMFKRPITSSQWSHYEIVGDVDDDAYHITIGMFLAGEGQAWVDDVSLQIVGPEVAATAWRIGGSRGGGTALNDIQPGLFEVVSSTRFTPNENPLTSISNLLHSLGDEPSPQQQTVLLPLPLSYRDQVPIGFQLTVDPPSAVQAIDVYEDQPNNFVAKLVLDDADNWQQVEITYASAVLVGPSEFDTVPDSTPIPDAWPEEAQSWLASTWCADAKHERIQALAAEIRADTSDVRQIIRRVQQKASSIFRAAKGQGKDLTAVEALDKLGSCTSCANLVAALLRACDVPARVLSGYPCWSGPLQTHYIVEAYVPDYGWYPIESTLCQSPWPNTHQVNVAIIPPEYEQHSKADFRSCAAGGVPYLSLTEMPQNNGSVNAQGLVDESRNCDHVCRMIRTLDGSTDEWQQAIADARSRWQAWLASDHALDADGQLRFGTQSDEIAATSVTALRAELGP